jgi:transposase
MAAGRVKGTLECSPDHSSDSVGRAHHDESAIIKASKTYAGLDVSLKETAICVVDDAGKIVFERTATTDPQVIAKYLAKHAPGLERFGLESGSTSAWLWREFRQLGLPVICLDSRHAHGVLSMKRNKNRHLARHLAQRQPGRRAD